MPGVNIVVSATVQNAVQGLQQVAATAGTTATAAAAIAPAVATASQALAQMASAGAAANGGMQQLSASAQAAQAAYASISSTANAFTQQTASLVQAAQAQANGARAIANGFTIIGQAAQQSLVPLTPLGRALQQVNQSTASTAKASAAAAGGFQHIGNSAFVARQGVQNLSNIFRDLPFILNNPGIGAAALDHIVGTVNVLREETGSLKGAFSALGASLLGGGGLVVGINLALAAFSLLAGSFGHNSKSAKEAANSTNEYAEALKRANEAAGAEFASVAKLVTEAIDPRNASLEKQKKILTDLKQINSAYFDDLKIENGLISGLSDAYAKYADNIFKVAKAKGAEDQIKNLSTQLVGITGKINDISGSLQLNTNTFGRLSAIAKASNAQNIDDLFKAGDKVNEILQKYSQSTQNFSFLSKEAAQDINFLSAATGLSEQQIVEKLKVRQDLRFKELGVVEKISELSKFINSQEGIKISTDTNAKDKLNPVEETLRKLIIDRDELAKNPLLSFDEKDAKDLDLLNSALLRLRELKVSDKNPIILTIRADIADDAARVALDKFHEQLKKTGVSDVSAIPVPISFELRKDSGLQKALSERLTELDQFRGAAQKKLSKLILDPKAFDQQTTDLAKAAAEQANIIGNTIAAIFESAGAATSIRGFFSDVGQVLGEGMKQLGKSVIETSTLIAAIKKALNTALGGNPISGILAGIALIASGNLIERALPKFATGAVVYGPTTAIVGDNPNAMHDPEVIAPLSKLQSIMHSDDKTPNQLFVTGRLQGGDIYLSNSRTGVSRKRIWGK